MRLQFLTLLVIGFCIFTPLLTIASSSTSNDNSAHGITSTIHAARPHIETPFIHRGDHAAPSSSSSNQFNVHQQQEESMKKKNTRPSFMRPHHQQIGKKIGRVAPARTASSSSSSVSPTPQLLTLTSPTGVISPPFSPSILNYNLTLATENGTPGGFWEIHASISQQYNWTLQDNWNGWSFENFPSKGFIQWSSGGNGKLIVRVTDNTVNTDYTIQVQSIPLLPTSDCAIANMICHALPPFPEPQLYPAFSPTTSYYQLLFNLPAMTFPLSFTCELHLNSPLATVYYSAGWFPLLPLTTDPNGIVRFNSSSTMNILTVHNGDNSMVTQYSIGYHDQGSAGADDSSLNLMDQPATIVPDFQSDITDYLLPISTRYPTYFDSIFVQSLNIFSTVTWVQLASDGSITQPWANITLSGVTGGAHYQGYIYAWLKPGDQIIFQVTSQSGLFQTNYTLTAFDYQYSAYLDNPVIQQTEALPAPYNNQPALNFSLIPSAFTPLTYDYVLYANTSNYPGVAPSFCNSPSQSTNCTSLSFNFNWWGIWGVVNVSYAVVDAPTDNSTSPILPSSFIHIPYLQSIWSYSSPAITVSPGQFIIFKSDSAKNSSYYYFYVDAGATPSYPNPPTPTPIIPTSDSSCSCSIIEACSQGIQQEQTCSIVIWKVVAIAIGGSFGIFIILLLIRSLLRCLAGKRRREELANVRNGVAFSQLN